MVELQPLISWPVKIWDFQGGRPKKQVGEVVKCWYIHLSALRKGYECSCPWDYSGMRQRVLVGKDSTDVPCVSLCHVKRGPWDFSLDISFQTSGLCFSGIAGLQEIHGFLILRIALPACWSHQMLWSFHSRCFLVSWLVVSNIFIFHNI